MRKNTVVISPIKPRLEPNHRSKKIIVSKIKEIKIKGIKIKGINIKVEVMLRAVIPMKRILTMTILKIVV